MTPKLFPKAPQDNNYPSKTYLVGAGIDAASMVDNEHLKCTATLLLYIYNFGKCRVTVMDEFFRAFATLILWNHIFGFPCCIARKDFSIDASITNVGLILTKLRWFQPFVRSQNSNFELFWKKFKLLGFHGVVLVKTFPLMCQLLGMHDWYWRCQGPGYFFRGMDRWTDRHSFGILIWNHVSTHKISTQYSKLVVSCQSLYASQEGRDA